MQCWTLPIVLLAVVGAAIAAPFPQENGLGDVSTTPRPSLSSESTLNPLSSTQPSILSSSRKPHHTLPTLKPFSHRTKRPSSLETPKPFSLNTIEPISHHTRKPFSLETPKPFSLNTIEPISHESRKPFSLEPISHRTRKPLSPETPKPFSLETPKPFSIQTPKPFSIETLKPFSLETPKPFSIQTAKPFSIETLKPFSFETLQPLSRSTKSLFTPTEATPIRNARSVDVKNAGWEGPGWQLMETPSTFNVNDAVMASNDETHIASDDSSLNANSAAYGTTLSGPGWQTMETEATADLSEDVTTVAAEDTTDDQKMFAHDLISSTYDSSL